jgi:hypothetical protein
MNFKKWLISEEIYPQNKTATVYHRTSKQSVANLLKSDFRSGTGCLYGCGLYTTFALDSQFAEYMDQYGDTLVKFKASKLDDYLIVHKSVARQLLGEKYKISDQLKKFGVASEVKPEDLELFDDLQEKQKFSSITLQQIYSKYPTMVEKLKGVIYYGSNDGYCLLKYPPVEDGTIEMLGFAQALVDDSEKRKQLENNQGWIKLSGGLSIKDLRKLPSEERKKRVVDFYDLETDEEIINYIKSNQPILDDDHFVTKITIADRIVPYMSTEAFEYLIANNSINTLLQKSRIPQKVLQTIINKVDPMYAKNLAKEIAYFADDPVSLADQVIKNFVAKYPSNKLDNFFTEIIGYAKPKHTTNIINMLINSGIEIEEQLAMQILRRTPNDNQVEMLKYLLKKYGTRNWSHEKILFVMKDKETTKQILHDMLGGPPPGANYYDDLF